MELSHVYVLSAGPDLYKIGLTADDVQKRVKALSTGSAHRLTEVAVFDVPRKMAYVCERAVHCALTDLACSDAGGREFFRSSSSEELCSRVEEAVRHVLQVDSLCVQALEGIPSEPEVFDAEKAPAYSVLLGLLAQRRCLEGKIRKLALEKELIEKAVLRHCPGGLSLGSRPLLEWRSFSRKQVDLTQLRREYAAVADTVTKTVSCRRPVWH